MSTQPVPPATAKKLYVICHGALATLQTDHNLIVMIPDMGSNHAYRAGSWLTETTIEKGSLHTLENVTGGDAPVSNLFPAAPRPDTAPRPPFATFVLPRPIAVHSLFQVSISKNAFAAEKGTIVPTSDVVAPLVPIFEYTYTTTPRLGSMWPVLTDDVSGLPDNPATLHIFAEDEIPLDNGHFVSAFNRTCKLLGLNTKLSSEGLQDLLTPGDLGTVPAGLENRLFEFEPLNHRRAALLATAKAKESGGTLADPWNSLPTVLADLGDAFFGQQGTTSTVADAPAPAAAAPGAFTPHWKNPACVHVILGDVGVANATP